VKINLETFFSVKWIFSAKFHQFCKIEKKLELKHWMRKSILGSEKIIICQLMGGFQKRNSEIPVFF